MKPFNHDMNPAMMSGACAALKPMKRPIYPPEYNNTRKVYNEPITVDNIAPKRRKRDVDICTKN